MSSATKRLAIALAISVAANLFVAGFVIARAVYHVPHHREGMHGPFLGPHGMLRDQRGPLQAWAVSNGGEPRAFGPFDGPNGRGAARCRGRVRVRRDIRQPCRASSTTP
jgi:hypothetical protein